MHECNFLLIRQSQTKLKMSKLKKRLKQYNLIYDSLSICKSSREFSNLTLLNISEPYVPVAASVSLPPLNVPPPGYPPEVVGLNRKRPFHELVSEANTYPPQKRFDFNRLGRGGRPMFRGARSRGRGGRGGGLSDSGNLTSQLAVRNIPPAFNSIAHLNNHFARFGTLTNVQVHFEGDPASALVS